MISVLLPTRARVAHLDKSVSSLRDFAVDPDRLEIVVRYDDDDAVTVDALPSTLRQWKTTILGGPRWGYKRMHDYYNQLAAASHGDFLLVWNDDTEMLTQGWDEKLREAPLYSVQFIRRDIFETADITFPVVGRPVYERLGCLAKNAHLDLWLGELALGAGDVHESVEGAGIGIYRNDIVFHHHRLDDQTSRERDESYDLAGFSSPEMRAVRAEAVKRLLEGKP